MRPMRASPILVLSALATTGAGAQSTWSLSERPTLVIGTVDGPPWSVFHDIRGVMTAEDTLIVVADGGDRELRVFTNDGRPVGAFGSEGGGPREFRAIHWADRCGGSSVVVYDFGRRRVTRWNARGDLLEGVNVESTEPERPPYALSCGPGGGFAVVGWPDALAQRVVQGPYRVDTNVGVLGPDGRLERVLGRFPGPERFRYPGERLSDGPRPFGRTTTARMGPGGVFVGTADAYEIRVFRADGGSFTFGKPDERRALTPGMLEAWRDSVLAPVPPDRQARARGTLGRYEMPETLPAYADFRFDELGLLWVALYPPPGPDPVQWDVWEVSGTGGVQIASIRIPRHFRPTEIGADYLLGVSTDALGMERVHRYRLTR
jgi:hypothetical protein